jgi:membrane protein implicated in regulation of membrane protease activity
MWWKNYKKSDSVDKAVSTVPIPAGERIIVRQVDGLTLRVEPVAATRPVMA